MIFKGLMQRIMEDARIEELRIHFKTAKDIGKKECINCGFCCHRRPCILLPEELDKIAEFLKMDKKSIIKKFFCVDEKGGIFFVKPAGINQMHLLGKYLEAEDTFNEGKCIFLDENNRCKIHEVKPRMAKIMKCWEEKSRGKSVV